MGNRTLPETARVPRHVGDKVLEDRDQTENQVEKEARTGENERNDEDHPSLPLREYDSNQCHEWH